MSTSLQPKIFIFFFFFAVYSHFHRLLLLLYLSSQQDWSSSSPPSSELSSARTSAVLLQLVNLIWSYIWISPDTRLHFKEVFPCFLVGSRGVAVICYLLVGALSFSHLRLHCSPLTFTSVEILIELTGNSVEYVLFGSFPFSEFKLLLLPPTDKKFYVKVFPPFKH